MILEATTLCVIIIILLTYLIFLGHNELIMSPEMTFGSEDHAASKPWQFILDKGPWPIIHFKNNLIVILLITQNPVFSFIIALVWEFVETLLYIIIATMFVFVSKEKKFSSVVDFFYETGSDSAVGDVLQCLLAMFLGLVILYVLKIKSFTSVKKPFYINKYVWSSWINKCDWLWSGSKYAWYKREYDFQIRAYLSVFFLIIISYGSCFNYKVKHPSFFDKNECIGFSVFFPAEILFYSLLRNFDINYLKRYKHDPKIIEKYHRLYDLFILVDLVLYITSVSLSQNPLLTSWATFFIFVFISKR